MPDTAEPVVVATLGPIVDEDLWAAAAVGTEADIRRPSVVLSWAKRDFLQGLGAARTATPDPATRTLRLTGDRGLTRHDDVAEDVFFQSQRLNIPYTSWSETAPEPTRRWDLTCWRPGMLKEMIIDCYDAPPISAAEFQTVVSEAAGDPIALFNGIHAWTAVQNAEPAMRAELVATIQRRLRWTTEASRASK